MTTWGAVADDGSAWSTVAARRAPAASRRARGRELRAAQPHGGERGMQPPPPLPPPADGVSARLSDERWREAGKRIRQALIALNAEGAAGCIDVRGRTGATFSEWASGALSELGPLLIAGDERLRFSELHAGFRAYRSLGVGDRLNLVREMLAFLVEVSGAGARHVHMRPEHVVFTDTLQRTVTEAVARQAAGEVRAQTAVDAQAHTRTPPPQQQQQEWGAASVDARASAATAAEPLASTPLDTSANSDARLDSTGSTTGGAASPASVAQRSAEWHALRSNRITASAFCNAAGLFDDGQLSLWEEKLGLRTTRENDAMRYGTRHEPLAYARYAELTGNTVRELGFHIYGQPREWEGEVRARVYHVGCACVFAISVKAAALRLKSKCLRVCPSPR